jgi:hypothetical protein
MGLFSCHLRLAFFNPVFSQGWRGAHRARPSPGPRLARRRCRIEELSFPHQLAEIAPIYRTLGERALKPKEVEELLASGLGAERPR